MKNRWLKTATLVGAIGLVVGVTATSAWSDPSKVGTRSAFGAGLKLTSKVVARGNVLSVVGPWMVWDPSACGYVVAKTHPATYTAAARRIAGKWQIGYMHYGDSDPFGIANSVSVKQTAKLAGFSINVYSLEYPSKTVPIAQAKLSVVRHDRGVLQGNLDPTILPSFLNIVQKKGCSPTIAVYGGPGDKTPAMGAIFAVTGKLQGRWMAQEARRRGWSPRDTAFVQCTDPSLAPFVQKLFPASIAALSSSGFSIPKSNIYQLNCQGQSSTTAQQVVRDWFTAHPNYKNVMLNGPDDQRVTGIIQALKAVKRLDATTIRVGAGLDPVGRAQVRSKAEDASVAFFPEQYGLFLVPMIEDILAGNPVPQFVQNLQTIVTNKNIAKYYANGK